MFRLSILFIFLGLAGAGRAETFTPEAAVARALRQNPDLAAARLAIQAAEGRLLHSGLRANPELESEVKPSLRGREFSVGVGFVQRFPLTNRLHLEKAVSQAELEAAAAEVRAAERRLAAEVRTLAVGMQALQARRALVREQIANSEELARTAAKVAAAGEGSTLEAAQLELASEQLSLEELQADAELVALDGSLRPLLSAATRETVEISGELGDPVVPASAAPDLATRPEMQAAAARVEAARQNLELQQKNRWEDAAIGVSAEVERSEDAPDGLQTDGFLALKFSLPLPLWNKNEGRILEAGATAARREKEAAALADRIRAEAAAARGAMTAAAALHERISATLLPKSRQLEERFLASYQSGQTALTDVLRSREQRISLEAARLNARRDFHLARIRFEAALGR